MTACSSVYSQNASTWIPEFFKLIISQFRYDSFSVDNIFVIRMSIKICYNVRASGNDLVVLRSCVGKGLLDELCGHSFAAHSRADVCVCEVVDLALRLVEDGILQESGFLDTLQGQGIHAFVDLVNNLFGHGGDCAMPCVLKV